MQLYINIQNEITKMAMIKTLAWIFTIILAIVFILRLILDHQMYESIRDTVFIIKWVAILGLIITYFYIAQDLKDKLIKYSLIIVNTLFGVFM